ncbi:hypothetical protein [Dechloromonas sp. HYN0024]|nr:hypothetical protein [Dechloromonas sp. HYN0024]
MCLLTMVQPRQTSGNTPLITCFARLGGLLSGFGQASFCAEIELALVH